MENFSEQELKMLRRLSTPAKIQDYLDALPINFEPTGDTLRSPRRVLRDRTCHCIEGALLAAAALWVNGQRPLLLDLKADARDFDHVVALYRVGNRWGAISKTNHAVLRYREPVYRTVRELALSFFHEYFNDDGHKTLRSYSQPFDLRQYASRGWATDEEDLWYIGADLDDSPHVPILPSRLKLRRAHPLEIEAGKLQEWRD